MFFAKNKPTDCVASGGVMVGELWTQRYFKYGRMKGGRVQGRTVELGDVLYGVLAELIAEDIWILWGR